MLIFVLGFTMGMGLVILALILYLRLIKKSTERNFKKIFRELEEQNAIDDEVKKIISNAKSKVLKWDNLGVQNNLKNLKNVSLEMAMGISKKYNPDVDYPHLELTFYELLKLNEGITQFFIENLNKKYFTHLKKAKVSHILELNDLKNKHISKVETGNKILTAIKFFINPVGTIIKKATMAVALPLAIESFFKIGGKYGIEKLGMELNLIYSGYYQKKLEENLENDKENIDQIEETEELFLESQS